eukprot:9532_1
MMRDFETYVGPDFIQPGEERLLRSYQPAQPRVNRQPETEVLVAVKEIGKPLKIVQPGTAYLGRNAVHKLQQAGCYGGPAKADVGNTEELETTIKTQAKTIGELEVSLKLEKAKTPPVGNTEELETTIKDQDAKIRALEETIEANDADIQAKENEIQGLKTGVTQEKTKTDDKIRALKETITARDTKIEELHDSIADIKVKADRGENKIKLLQEHLVSTLPLEVGPAIAHLDAGQNLPTFDLLDRLATEIGKNPKNKAQLEDMHSKLHNARVRNGAAEAIAHLATGKEVALPTVSGLLARLDTEIGKSPDNEDQLKDLRSELFDKINALLRSGAAEAIARMEAVEQDKPPPSTSVVQGLLDSAIEESPDDVGLKDLRSKLFDLRMIKRGGQLARVLEVSAVGADVASTMSIARSLVKERQGVDVQSQAVGAAKARLEAAIHKHS